MVGFSALVQYVYFTGGLNHLQQGECNHLNSLNCFLIVYNAA